MASILLIETDRLLAKNCSDYLKSGTWFYSSFLGRKGKAIEDNVVKIGKIIG